MSRIGNKAIKVPSGVKVEIKDGVVAVEGKAKLALNLPPHTDVVLKDGVITVLRKDETRTSNAMQGLARSLINNMIIGVTAGFRKDLQIIGVGYRAQLTGNKLGLSLGYSHPVEYQIPDGIKVTVTEGVKLSVEGADKHMVGEVAATIRRFRKPEPYKGKGIRYVGEHIVMKEGKTVGK